ncbi:hypothetical protein BH09ACT3_BH09ACT3_04130 [soil metagenome]
MDGTAYFTARQKMWEVTAARDRAGRLGKRAASRAATDAAREYRTTEEIVLGVWGSVPQTPTGIPSWAEAVAHKRADIDPLVTVATRDAAWTRGEQQRLAAHRADERAALRRRIPGNLPADTVAAQWRGRAEQARRDLAKVESLSVTGAAQLIRDRAARAQTKEGAVERAQSVRAARANKLSHSRSPAAGNHSALDRGFGPSL